MRTAAPISAHLECFNDALAVHARHVTTVWPPPGDLAVWTGGSELSDALAAMTGAMRRYLDDVAEALGPGHAAARQQVHAVRALNHALG